MTALHKRGRAVAPPSRRALLRAIIGAAAVGSNFTASSGLAHLLDKPSKDAPGRHPALVSKGALMDKGVEEQLVTIDRDRLIGTVKELELLGTRWTGSETASERSAAYIANKFVEISTDSQEVETQIFPYDGGYRKNIICRSATLAPNSIIICAHYDTLSEQAGTRAPGADDNGSGIAVLLETARTLAGTKAESRVIYCAFGGEEQGLIGSRFASAEIKAQQWPISLVINLDMVGYVKPSQPEKIIVEYDQGNVSSANDIASRAYGLLLAQVVSTYTELVPEHTNIWNSDYMPFEAQGYPSIGLYDEAADAAFYHKSTDTSEHVNADRLVSICRAVTAFVLSLT